jgi:hypothetical protein
MTQLPLIRPSVAALLASAFALTGCVQPEQTNQQPYGSQGIAQDTPFRGAPVTILDAAQGHIVYVPQRNARSLSEATCRVVTTLSASSGRIHGRALESQPGQSHSREACCNIKEDFTFSVGGQTIQLRTQEPQWCRDSNGSGRSSPTSPGPSDPGPSLGGSMGN